MFKLSLFLLLVFYIHNSSCLFADLINAGKLVWDSYSMIDEISVNDTNLERLNNIFIAGNVGDQEMKNQMNEIFKKFDEIESSMHSKKFSNSLNSLVTDANQRASVFKLELFIKSIDSSYNEFKKYMNRETVNSDDALTALVEKTIVDLEGAITLIRKLIIEDNPSLLNYKNIIEAIAAVADLQRDELCDGQQLIISILAQLFRMVLIAEIKANFILLIANIHHNGKHDGWHEMISFSEGQFKEHVTNYVKVFTQNMIGAESVYLRACDPVDYIWIRDQNFYELETVQTELFRYTPKPSEPDRCTDTWFIEHKKYLSRQTPRSDCSYTGCYDLGAIKTCVLENDLSRYHFVNSTKLGVLGRNLGCLKNNTYGYDGACACTCSGNYNKISFSIMQSRIESNWVIIGLRFIRQNKVLYIQPREGKLEANGYISPDNQAWIPIPNNPEVHSIQIDSRVFFLDDLRLPPYHVLTGVKINELMRGIIVGFAIQIFGTPFNYESGRCVGLHNLQVPVKAMNVDPGVSIAFSEVLPNYSRVRHTPVASGFVSLEKFELSDDFGQSTVPFFDAVPIVPSQPSILGGVGLFHKVANGSAGFISLRVFGIRYTKYLLDYQRHTMVDGSVFFDHP